MATENRTLATSPYTKLREALLNAGARCLREIPQKSGPQPFTLEIWNCATPAPGRLVIVQRWHKSGGFDYYLQGAEIMTYRAIADVLGL